MRDRRRNELTRRCSFMMGVAWLLATALGADAGKPEKLVLFDGKSLEGWKKTDYSGSAAVKVEDGTLVVPAGRPMSGVTCTRRDLPTTNYEFTYQAMRLKGSDFFAAATFPVGKSYLTFVNGGWGGNVTGLSNLNGADASENETNRFVKYQDKTWYKFRVRVTDRTIRCWIDDKSVVVLRHEGLQLGTRIETRANQPLGFATYDSAGALRDIEVRTLTRDEITETDKTE